MDKRQKNALLSREYQPNQEKIRSLHLQTRFLHSNYTYAIFVIVMNLPYHLMSLRSVPNPLSSVILLTNRHALTACLFLWTLLRCSPCK